jgi:Zn-dependent protease with chaperone function
MLVVASLAAAAATGFVLAVIAFSVIALDAEVASLGHWSVAVLQAGWALPRWAGICAAGLVGPLLGAAIVRAFGAGRQLWLADATCRKLGPGVEGLVIFEDERPDAFALQGIRGRTVVSTGMLAALTPAERRVLLAHEASHLRNRHALYVLLVGVAAAGNPLLRPVSDAVRLGVERWADEDAAAAVGDRTVAARAVARAAVASRGFAAGSPSAAVSTRRPGAALAMTASALATRARALLNPAPQRRRGVTGLVLAAALSCVVTTAMVAHTTENHFERAQLPSASASR